MIVIKSHSKPSFSFSFKPFRVSGLGWSRALRSEWPCIDFCIIIIHYYSVVLSLNSILFLFGLTTPLAPSPPFSRTRVCVTHRRHNPRGTRPPRPPAPASPAGPCRPHPRPRPAAAAASAPRDALNTLRSRLATLWRRATAATASSAGPAAPWACYCRHCRRYGRCGPAPCRRGNGGGGSGCDGSHLAVPAWACGCGGLPSPRGGGPARADLGFWAHLRAGGVAGQGGLGAAGRHGGKQGGRGGDSRGAVGMGGGLRVQVGGGRGEGWRPGCGRQPSKWRAQAGGTFICLISNLR